MSFLASLDGAIAPIEQTSIPVADEGLLRGDGGFEVTRLYGGRPFALDDHFARLERTRAGIRLEVDHAALRRGGGALLQRTGEGGPPPPPVVAPGGPPAAQGGAPPPPPPAV